jgi:hypothetical protein
LHQLDGFRYWFRAWSRTQRGGDAIRARDFGYETDLAVVA